MVCPKRCPKQTTCNKKTKTCESKTLKKTNLDLAFLFLTFDDIIHTKTKQFIKPYSVYVNAKTPDVILKEKYTITNHPTEWGKRSFLDALLHLLRVSYEKNHLWYVFFGWNKLKNSR